MENSFNSVDFEILSYRQKKNLLIYIIGLAATPLEVSSGTLDVFFYFKYVISAMLRSSLYVNFLSLDFLWFLLGGWLYPPP